MATSGVPGPEAAHHEGGDCGGGGGGCPYGQRAAPASFSPVPAPFSVHPASFPAPWLVLLLFQFLLLIYS